MKNNLLRKMILLTVFAIASSAFAEEQVLEDMPTESASEGSLIKTKSGKPPRMVKVVMTDELVKGANPSPEAEYIFTKTQFNFKKMIKLRDNFIPEAAQGKAEFNGSN